MAIDSPTSNGSGGENKSSRESEAPKYVPPTTSAPNLPEHERNNFTKVIRGLESAERRLRVFWEFLKPNRALVVLVFLLGVILALLSETTLAANETHHSSWYSLFMGFISHTIRYLAHGFIVSSVCVFGFEYLKEARGDFKRETKMDGLVISLDEAVRALREAEPTNQILDQVKTDLEVLRAEISKDMSLRVISQCFSQTNTERALSRSLIGLIQASFDLKRTNTADSQLYLEFIGWHCNYISQNARALASLEEDIGNENGDDEFSDPDFECSSATYSTVWPTSPEVSARIAGIKLKGLGPGDSYWAVSNPLFWNKRESAYLMEQTARACQERNVTVRRIFNLCDLLYLPGLLDEKFDVAKSIVDAHLQLQKQTGGKYEVRFFGPNQVDKAVKADRNINPHNLSCTLFVVFNRSDPAQPDAVRYRTENAALSRLTLGRADVTKYQQRFDMMWELCEGVPNPFGSDAHEFKQTMSLPGVIWLPPNSSAA